MQPQKTNHLTIKIMATQEQEKKLRHAFWQGVTTEYFNGWARHSFNEDPLWDAGFEKIQVPAEFDWDQAWKKGDDLLLIGWHQDQLTMVYYCHAVMGYFTNQNQSKQ